MDLLDASLVFVSGSSEAVVTVGSFTTSINDFGPSE